MPNNLRPKYYLLIILLLLAQLGVYLVAHSSSATPSDPAADVSALPLNFFTWEGYDGQLDDVSLEMLNPEAYIFRDYITQTRDKGLNLTIIYGHAKSNFHSPALCFLGSGWMISKKGKAVIEAGDPSHKKQYEMTRLQIDNSNNRRSLVFYTFLTPGKSTASWSNFQMQFLIQRLKGRRPRGALLRVVIPVTTTEEDARKVAEKFLTDADPYLKKAFNL